MTNLLNSSLAIFRIELHRILSARMIWLVGLVFFLPSLTFFLRPPPLGPQQALLLYAFVLYIYYQALLPLAALLYASSTIRDEQDQRTLGYLLLRPTPRWLIFVSKFFACALVLTTLACASITWCHVAYWKLAGASLPAGYHHLPTLGWTLALAVAGSFSFLAVFSVISTLFRRALVAGLIYAFFIEIVLTWVPAMVARLSCVFYLRSLLLRPPFGNPSLQKGIEEGMNLFDVPSRSTSSISLLLVTLTCIILSSLIFTFREYAAQAES